MTILQLCIERFTLGVNTATINGSLFSLHRQRPAETARLVDIMIAHVENVDHLAQLGNQPRIALTRRALTRAGLIATNNAPGRFLNDKIVEHVDRVTPGVVICQASRAQGPIATGGVALIKGLFVKVLSCELFSQRK